MVCWVTSFTHVSGKKRWHNRQTNNQHISDQEMLLSFGVASKKSTLNSGLVGCKIWRQLPDKTPACWLQYESFLEFEWLSACWGQQKWSTHYLDSTEWKTQRSCWVATSIPSSISCIGTSTCHNIKSSSQKRQSRKPSLKINHDKTAEATPNLLLFK